MSGLPGRYQHYARQPAVQAAEIELYGERDPVVWVPDAYGQMVPMRKSQAPAPVQAPPARDLSPQPLFDPIAQRMVGAGVGSGAALWGGGQFLAGAGQFVSSLSGVGALLFFLALAGGRVLLGGGRGVTHIHNEQHTHVEQKWLGRAGVRNDQSS